MANSAVIQDGVVVNVCLGIVPGSVPCGDTVQIGWHYDGQQFNPPLSPSPEINLSVIRSNAIAKLELLASAITAAAIGTDDQQKLKRYDNNVACAIAILDGTASESVATAMAAMLQANQSEAPAVFADMTLKSFCEWLVGLRGQLEVLGLRIEVLRLQSRMAINAADSLEVIAATLQGFQDAFKAVSNSA